jgi:hypothetical protein
MAVRPSPVHSPTEARPKEAAAVSRLMRWRGYRGSKNSPECSTNERLEIELLGDLVGNFSGRSG